MEPTELDPEETNQPVPSPRSATGDGTRQRMLLLPRALSVKELRVTRQVKLHRHASALSTLDKIPQSNRSSADSLADTSAAVARFHRTESLDSITKKPTHELQMDPHNLTTKHELMMDRFNLRRMPTVRVLSASSVAGNGIPTSRRNSLDPSTHFSSHQRSLNHVTPQDTQSQHTTEAPNRRNSGGDLATTLEFASASKQRRQWVLSACSPTSLRTRIRLVLLTVVFALQTIYMPFSVVYSQPNDRKFLAIDVVIDAIYCLNIVALVNTVTHTNRGILVTTRRAIWRQYRSSGFVRDLLAALPLELLLLWSPPQSGWRWVMRAVQLALRFVSLRDHIIAFFKLLSKDAIRTDKSILAWLLYSKYSHLVRILGIVTFILVLAHYMACIWSWLDPSVDTTHLEDPVRFHTQSLYAALQLLQGQGVTAITSAQALFGSAAVLLGSIVLAVIFGHVAVLVANFQANATTYQRKMERVFAIMSKLQLPHPIRERGHQYYEYLNVEYESLDGEIVKFAKDGEFNLASLLAAHAVGDDVLCLGDGTGIERKDFPLLLRSPDTRVGDIVAIEWVAPRHVKFRSRQHEWPLGRQAVDQFRRFCDVLVHNYPAVLQPHNAPDELQPRPPMHAVWSVSTDDDGSTSLVVEPNPGQLVDLGSVHTKRMAERLARRHEPTLLSFDDHPLLDAHASLWTSRAPTERPTPRTPARVQRAQRELVSRYRRTLAADRVIGTALATVSWRDIAQLPASSSAQRLLLHKIKGLRLSGWDRSAERRGCPHCPDAPRTVDTGHAFHIVWHCPSAQLLWTELRQAWSRLGVDIVDTATLCKVVFSLSLPRNPADVWDDMGSTPPPDLVPLVDDLMATLWRQQVVGCLQRIWQWRNCVADETDPWDLRVARSALLGSFRAAYQQARGSLELAPREHRPFLGSLLGRLQSVQLATEPRAPRSVRTDTDRYLLFFDGGSRGNPGPGGSGAVIIRVHASGGMPRIHWAASMSLASPTTTNNQAEYFGLVVGLRFAAAHKLQPLSVIGDSAMIIRQLKDTRAPKHPRLLVYYGQARILADKVTVTEWRHHVRAFNKMADWAANLAMDSKRSVQTLLPQTRSVWAGLSAYLAEDVGQWQASTPPGDAGTG